MQNPQNNLTIEYEILDKSIVLKTSEIIDLKEVCKTINALILNVLINTNKLENNSNVINALVLSDTVFKIAEDQNVKLQTLIDLTKSYFKGLELKQISNLEIKE